MLGNYTVDELLFMIDVAKVQRKEKQLRTLRNAFELEKYLEEARDFIQRKENIHKVTGINREIKRHAKIVIPQNHNNVTLWVECGADLKQKISVYTKAFYVS